MSDKFRKIGAWSGIIVLIGIYLLTLISAILQKDNIGGLFIASLYCTFVVPVWIFVLQMIYKRTHKDSVSKKERNKIWNAAMEEDVVETEVEERIEDTEIEDEAEVAEETEGDEEAD